MQITPFSVFFSSDESALMITITSAVVALLVVFLQWRLHRKKQRRKLPPGSMGWPYIGETLRLYTENPNSFFATRQNKYGEIFKTHILGCPCVMISSPEAARMVLISKAHMFKPTYPASKERIIGPEALFFHQGPYHSTLKRLVQSSFMPSALRPTVSHIELLVLKILASWTSQKSINTLQHMKRYAFDVAIMSAFGDKEEPTEIEAIKLLYQRLEMGYNSMPLNLPGTLFRKSMKARRELSDELRRLIEKRRESRREGGGLLGVLLGAKDQKRNGLSDSQIADNIIGVIFAATDTTASVLTWLLKYLHDHPNVLQEVSVAPKPYTFMPFGSGSHSCPGSELAKLEMLVLLHHLTTSFRWKVVGGEEGIQYGPFPVPKKGLPIRVTPI
ncbi:hypothetical protein YC2023_054777 [Brassica napus]